MACRRDHGTRADQALLQAPPCRPDPGDLRPGHRAAGDHQVLLRRQPDPDTGTRGFPVLRLRAPARVGSGTSSIPTGGWSISAFAGRSSAAVFAFLQFTTFGMVVRAGMADRETVGLLGINIDKRSPSCSASPRCRGLAGVMYTPINSPNYHMGMDFLVLSFVVVVVGGMGSLRGAVLAGFLLGILESFASMNARGSPSFPASTRSSSTWSHHHSAHPSAWPDGPQGRDGGLIRCLD
jgi:hypothetical protein